MEKQKKDTIKILIVDDDTRFNKLCEDIIRDMGLKPITASNGFEALEILEKEEVALSLIDLRMPKMSGLELLTRLSQVKYPPPVIIITAYGSIESAVEAMKLGAIDYIVKPATISWIRETVYKALENIKPFILEETEPQEPGRFGIIGQSTAMKEVYKRIDIMRNEDATVMIIGESGVGKELVARAIHYYGSRATEPFIPIDCSILSLNIVESELFGHVKGAFTDARYDRDGLLKLARRGTVFFDEITEIPIQAQSKLLRAIQEREIRPVGSSRVEKIEARIIAATNRNLEEAVRENIFREDLFYRLHVIPIIVPPLRDRKEDIPLLVNHFIKKYSTERKSVYGILPEALELLKEYNWPGNVRELENVIQEVLAFTTSNLIRPIDLPFAIRKKLVTENYDPSSMRTIKQMEIDTIKEALQLTNGNKTKAAKLLGIAKATLYDKLKRYRIET